MKKYKSVRGFTRTNFAGRNLSGFTLVELLIVIAIIAILAVIVTVVINPIEIMKQGRDSDRLAALASLQQAINVAAQEATDSGAKILCFPDGVVPCEGDSVSGSRASDGTGWIKVNLSSQKTVSMPTLPIDQTNSPELHYTYNSDGNGWEIDAVLESEKYRGKMGTDGGNDPAKYEVGSNLKLASPAI